MRPILVLFLTVFSLAAVSCSSGNKKSDAPAPAAPAATSAPSSSGAPPSSGASTAATATKPAAASSTNASAASLDPCKLLPKEDAAAVLGKPVADGKLNASETSPLGQKICFYASDPSGSGSVQLSVITSAGMTDALKKNGQTAKVQFGQEKALVPGVTAVTGVGDDAFIRGPSLYVLKGDVDMSIMVSGVGTAGDATNVTALKAVAAKVLPRLP